MTEGQFYRDIEHDTGTRCPPSRMYVPLPLRVCLIIGYIPPVFFIFVQKSNSYEGGISNLGVHMMYPTDVPGSDFANLTPHLPRYSTVAQLQL